MKYRMMRRPRFEGIVYTEGPNGTDVVLDDRQRMEHHLCAIRQEVETAINDLPGMNLISEVEEATIYEALEALLNTLHDVNEWAIERQKV